MIGFIIGFVCGVFTLAVVACVIVDREDLYA